MERSALVELTSFQYAKYCHIETADMTLNALLIVLLCCTESDEESNLNDRVLLWFIYSSLCIVVLLT